MFYWTSRCEECYFARWNIFILEGPMINFYIVPVCNNPNTETSGVLCCYKQICARECKFKLYCSTCSIKTDYTPVRYPFENDNDDRGNIIDNRADIRVPCRNCGDIIKKKMCFSDYYLEECG